MKCPQGIRQNRRLHGMNRPHASGRLDCQGRDSAGSEVAMRGKDGKVRRDAGT